MNEITKKQHYIWRNYLAPWTMNNSNTGRIMCCRNNKIFPVSLMKIAHENYFYGVKELSKQERAIISKLTIENVTGKQKEINRNWLDLYCAPFDFANKLEYLACLKGYPIDRIKNNQEFRNWNIEYIERIHCRIESTGTRYINYIKKNDLSFWQVEKNRDEFSFFICSQYFRTKHIRDSLTKVFSKNKDINKTFDICPENMWLPLSFIFASNVGAHVAHDFFVVLLQAAEGCFIVGDQPVINTYANFNALVPPCDMELFYPITPNMALLLTTNKKYVSGQIFKIGMHEVSKYNLLEVKNSGEEFFAKDKTELEIFKTV